MHPLAGWHRRIGGVRRGHLGLAWDRDAGIEAVGLSARFTLPTHAGEVEVLIIAVPDLVDRLVADQRRALALQVRAAQIAESLGASAIGLGSALAVVAGRGEALREHTRLPVTTGHAATAWAAGVILRQQLVGAEPVGVIGFKGAVGDAVAARLAAEGREVWVDAVGPAATRRARELGCQADDPVGVARRARVLLGASTTGPVLEPRQMPPDRVLVDLALPPTLAPGARPPGLRVIGGETLSVPGPIRAGFWGQVWLGMANYGRGRVFACLAEPMAMALGGHPGWSQGRRLAPEAVADVGATLTGLGYRPVSDPRR